MSEVFRHEVPNGYFVVYNEKPPFQIHEVHQTHSTKWCKLGESKKEADALYTEQFDQILSIKTADCIPLLAIGNQHIAMIHAGWRGLAEKIHLQEEMMKIKPHYFFIGPCIDIDHYEVGIEFRQYFPNSNAFKEKGSKLYFGPVQQILDELTHHFPQASIESSKLDTYSTPKLHSHRENQTSKRNYNLFIPKNKVF